MAETKDTPKEEKNETVEPRNEVVKDDVQEPAEDAKPAVDAAVDEGKKPKKSLKEFFKTKKGKITLASAVGVILIVIALFAVPLTRYAILGGFIRKDVSLNVIDSKTGKPVSDAEVSVPGTTGRTDKDGKATLSQVAVGQYKLTIKKKYHKDTSVDVTVPILSAANAGQQKLEATGRQVPVSVKNKLSGGILSKVTITAGESTAITDDKGEAVLVMPADVSTVKASLKAEGYNELAAEITVTEQKDDKNTFAMTSAGKVYFLSKRTGKINVMKSDLDGTNQQVVVQATGKESESGTVLLASRDWKYLLLHARRDSDQPKLYLINTATDQMTVVDEGNASFSLVGWYNHTFVYRVDRDAVKNWQPKKYALKSFDAEANKLLTLDESAGEGSSDLDFRQEFITQIYILDLEGKVVYTKNWNGHTGGTSKQSSVVSVQPNGANKKTLKAFDLGTYVTDGVLYEVGEIYYRTYQGNANRYYEYEDGAIKENTSIKNEDFSQFYPTWLLSPSSEKTFWYEPRDGKNTLLVGDKNGTEGKEVAKLSDYIPYGWFSDDYLLVSKGGSELYIVSTQNPDFTKAYKLTDYHKSNIQFNGYGGGYGGF
ncbi:MAG TPA: carboxypeptidase-like regulatory domain-containing protein [Candidatus Saccharimonadales bacterium]|nr:carboxypeptidase-like regulatory domain-containing protein [Candidatus Saccharimonadales bacterium]